MEDVGGPGGLSPLKQALVAIERLQKKINELENRGREPIAIIGMGCRFPGGSDDPERYWDVLLRAESLVRDLPADRWVRGESLAAELGGARGCYLDDPFAFAAEFFGVSPREAAVLDPQHRLLLEIAWEALEDACVVPGALRDSATGVFLGIMLSDYGKRFEGPERRDALNIHYIPGNELSFVAGRISYLLGLRGPAVALSTACSSSLVAVHLACQSLAARETSLAIAGGVNLVLAPEAQLYLHRVGALAADGRSKTFSAAADGMGRGEGGGIVVLKRLCDALRDGDRIYAVIRGTAVNHDGASAGITVPNGVAQEALVRAAIERAGLTARDVGFIEAHGTGTALGDPVEVHALGRAFADVTAQVLLGSAKACIGHLDSAAGVAGLIKAALAIRHGEVPPQPRFETANPRIEWSALPFTIPFETTAWGPERRHAGVSSFGLSGINAHAVLGPAPMVSETTSDHPGERTDELLLVSAKTPAALRAQVRNYAALLQRPDAPAWSDVCFSAAVGRTAFAFRACFVGPDAATVSEALTTWSARCADDVLAMSIASGESPRQLWVVPPALSVVPTTLATRLWQRSAAYRDAIVQCERGVVEAGASPPAWREGDFQSGADLAEGLDAFVWHYALGRAYSGWGVTPEAVLGFGVGEWVAAALGDGLSVAEAIAHLLRYPGGAASSEVVIFALASGDALRPYVDATTCEVRERLASTSEIRCRSKRVAEAVSAALRAAGIPNITAIGRSAWVDTPMTTTLEAARSSSTWIPVCVRGEDFAAARLRRRLEGTFDIIVGMGADAPFVAAVAATLLPEAGDVVIAREDSWGDLMEALGRLWVRGATVDWSALHGSGRSKVRLPTYPFERRTHVYDYTRTEASTDVSTASGHPLLGRCLVLAGPTRVFEARWAAEGSGDWGRVLEAIEAAAFLELGQRPHVVRDLKVRDAHAAERVIQLRWTAEGAERWSVQLHSRAADTPADTPWSLCAEAVILPLIVDEPTALNGLRVLVEASPDMSPEPAGHVHGAIRAWTRHENGSYAHLAADPPSGAEPEFRMHPELWQGACTLVVGSLLPSASGSSFTVRELSMFQIGVREAWARVQRHASGDVDVDLFDDRGRAVAYLRGCEVVVTGPSHQEDPSPGASGLAARETLAAVRTARLDEKEAAEYLESLVAQEVSRLLGLASGDDVVRDRAFADQGFDSVLALELRNHLASTIGRSLPASIVFDHPTVRMLARELHRRIGQEPTSTPTFALPPASGAEPIAIIGMACRFPGHANDLESFWNSLLGEACAVDEITNERWDIERYFDANVDAPDRMYVRHMAMIDGIDRFDAEFFGISRREAESIDPQHRILLEVTWHALENAGVPPERLVGERVGVFTGLAGAEYWSLETAIDAHTGTGTARSTAAGRVSYLLGCVGPSLSVDTACSSSLVCLHLACQSLRRGETDMALVGGAAIYVDPKEMIARCKVRALAPDGRSKAFDAAADGYGRGEGAGVVVLKRLSDARRDGDRIWAIVRGTAVNQDGRSNGLTAPNGTAQQSVIREALADGRVAASDVQYVEAHGTGTRLGDPIEVHALDAVYGEARAASVPLHIGSVKANIGHLEGAAGIASVIKLALALKHRELPAQVSFREPNPEIDWERIHVEVVSTRMAWPREPRSMGGVSSFGVSGTNAHAILERVAGSEEATADQERGFPIVLSGHVPDALHARRSDLATWWSAHPELALRDASYTLACRTQHHARRAAFVASSSAMAAAGLARVEARVTPCERGVVFVVGGPLRPEPRWNELLRLSTFASVTRRCATMLATRGRDRLAEFLASEDDQAGLSVADAEILAFVGSAALADTWRELGVRPAAVVGFGWGEPVAAYVAGALELEDALCVAIARAEAVANATRTYGVWIAHAGESAKQHGMLAHAPASRAIGQLTSALVVLGGPRHGVHAAPPFGEARAFLPGLGVAEDPVLLEAFLGRVPRVAPRPPTLPWFSCAGEGLVSDAGDPAFWAKSLVRLGSIPQVATRLLALDHQKFLDVSLAGGMVGPWSVAVARHEGASVVASLHAGDEGTPLVSAACRLFTAGEDIAWTTFFPRGGRIVDLPPYPFQHQRYWVTAPPRDGSTIAARSGPTRVSHAVRKGEHLWEHTIELARQTWIRDHRVQGATVMPAAGYLSMMLHAARELWGPQNALRIRNARFQAPLPLTEGDVARVQIVFTECDASRTVCRVFHRSSGEEWAPLAAAELDVVDAHAPPGVADPRYGFESSASFYAALRAAGLDYGDDFQRIDGLLRVGPELWARLRSPDRMVSSDPVHPAILDAIFHAGAHLLDLDRFGPAVPSELDELVVYGPLETKLSSRVRLTARTESDASFDCDVSDDAAALRVMVRGLRVRRVGAAASRTTNLELDWVAKAREPWTSSPSAIALLGDSPRRAALCRRWEAVGVPVRILEAASLEQESLREDEVVVFLCPMETPAEQVSDDSWALGSSGAAALLAVLRDLDRRARPPRLCVVTSSAVAVRDEDVDVSQAVAWGVAGTAILELPTLRCVRLDCGTAIDVATLADEITNADSESSLALRTDGRFVLRLRRCDPATVWVESRPRKAEGVGLVTQSPGRLDALHLRSRLSRAPGPGEVGIEVEAAGVNFRDVLLALGRYPGMEAGAIWIGDECCGTVVAIGPGVPESWLGERVMAIGADGSIGTYAVADAQLIARVPEALSSVVAAGVPVTYLTAWYALVDRAGIAPGANVLVHSATGGTGRAAMAVAHAFDANVFATAGSPEKREFLRSQGVAYVGDSRSLAFEREILDLTDGRGVDIVLNSLSGAAISAGLRTLAPDGHFLDLGKRDLYEGRLISLETFTKAISYTTIDLAATTARHPERIGKYLRELGERMGIGALQPPDVTCYPMEEAERAFFSIAQAKHLGKLVLARPSAEVPIVHEFAAPPLRDDASYVITGGTGALGLAVAAAFAQRGAGHLVLASRSEARTEAQRRAIADLRRTGVRITECRADVSRGTDVVRLLEVARSERMPLRGIVHAAGVLQDGSISTLSSHDMETVLRPKVGGAWNLHVASKRDPLDFFVMFSSVAAMFASAGQANYVAANQFLDSLAEARHRSGRPALSIRWGVFAEAGLAARQAERLAEAGVEPLLPSHVGTELMRRLASPHPHETVLSIDVSKWLERQPGMAATSLWSDVAPHPSSTSGLRPMVVELEALPLTERKIRFDETVKQELAAVLRTPAATIESDAAFQSHGLDSLMNLELRNRVETLFGLQLPPTITWNYPNLRDFSAYLFEQLWQDENVKPEPPREDRLHDLEDDVSKLSLAEVEQRLEQQLAALGLD